MRSAALPPHVPGDPVRLLWVPSGPTISVLFLGGYRGMLTHYYQSRPRPCLGETACPADRHRVPVVWYGYAPVELFRPESLLWVPYVLEITAHLEGRLAGRQLRGEVWQLRRREGKRKTAAVEGEKKDQFADAETSPCFDVLPVLQRFHREDALILDVANPARPMTHLPSAVRRPPQIDPAPVDRERATAPPPKDVPVARLDLAAVLPLSVEDVKRSLDRNGTP